MLRLFRKKIAIEERIRLGELVEKIELFPGTLEEFERMKNYGCEIIDNGQQDKRMTICLGPPLTKSMLENAKELERLGVEALIRYESRKSPWPSISNNLIGLEYPWNGKGLPVRRKYE